MSRRPRSGLQHDLLRLLQPPVSRRAQLPSERAAPVLAEVARKLSGRPAGEVAAALEEAVRSVGASPDRAALQEFAEEIEAGGNPFD